MQYFGNEDIQQAMEQAAKLEQMTLAENSAEKVRRAILRGCIRFVYSDAIGSARASSLEATRRPSVVFRPFGTSWALASIEQTD